MTNALTKSIYSRMSMRKKVVLQHDLPSSIPAAAATPQKRMHRAQQGVTLIELLVGIAIGLLTVTVAIGSLAISRRVSGTVTDATRLQQQASYAFRVIGQQLRQAGSLKLNLAIGKDEALDPDIADKVAFEGETAFNRNAETLAGADAPTSTEYKLATGYQNYKEKLVGKTTKESQMRDCKGEASSDFEVKSFFRLNAKNEIECAGFVKDKVTDLGAADNPQAVISNVTDFQVRYMVQNESAPGTPTIQYLSKASEVEALPKKWVSVYAVEVCLELQGTESIDTAGATYRDCSWKSGDAGKTKGNKLRMVFRNTYQLRSQGLTG